MNLENIIQGLDYLSQSANKSVIMMNNVLVLIVELAIIFTIRAAILVQINRIPITHLNSEQKRSRTLILNHVGYEILIAIVIGWFIMMLISSVQLNYVVNLIISPIVGTLGGIIIDNVYILPRRNNSLYYASGGSSNKEGKDNTAGHVEPITINITTGEDQHTNHTVNLLSEDLVDSDEFNIIVLRSLNSLTRTIIDLKESEMIERKMYLKSEMYRCLSNGFATPGEHDKIRNNYYAYRHLLGGNGDVQNLYENHFEHLGVHEDRRKNRGTYTGPERRINHNCEYGQFDYETQNNSEPPTLNNNE